MIETTAFDSTERVWLLGMENIGSFKKTIISLLVTIAAIAAVAVLFDFICGGRFLLWSNINAMAMSAIVTSFAAWGYCFIFALGYMDLSVGAASLLALYAAGIAGNQIGIPGVVIGGIIVGILLMTINFNIFAWTKIPSWIAGIGMCLIYEAFIAWYSAYVQARNTVVVVLEPQYRILAREPLIYVVFAIGLIFAYIMYNRTTLGLNVRAIGSNPDVSKIMGIKIPITLVLTGVVCGVLVGCNAFLIISRAGVIHPITGLGTLFMIFHPLATVLLAQVLSKRINIIVAVPFCAYFVYICFNVLSILGVPAGTLQEAVLGLSVIIFGVIAQRGTKGVVK